MLLSTIAWFYVTGSFFHWQMFCCDALGMALGGILFVALLSVARWFSRRTAGKHESVADRRFLKVATAILCGWIAIDVISLIRPALPIGAPAADPPLRLNEIQGDDLHVGLALSGGGYRAAVFHAGVLKALNSIGIKPNVISMVSGGSIIGAYYAIGGDPDAFKNAVAEGRLNLTHEMLLPHNLIRLPFPFTVPVFDTELFPWYRFSRKDVQAELLARVLYKNGATSTRTREPSIAIASTDLTFGNAVIFFDDGLLVIPPDGAPEVYRADSIRLDKHYSLAEKVAISGAFPFAFPPELIRANVGGLTVFNPGYDSRLLRLVDGGIADNSGYAALAALNEASCDAIRNREKEGISIQIRRPDGCVDAQMTSDVIIVSDASAIFGVEQGLSTMSTLSRTFDVQFAHAKKEHVREDNVVTISPQRYFSPSVGFMKSMTLYTDKGPINVGEMDDRLSVNFDLHGLSREQLERIVALLSNHTGEHSMEIKLERYLAAKAQGASACPSRPLMRRFECELCPDCLEGSLLSTEIGIAAWHLLDAFRETATLDDQLSSKRVDDLFRLGEVFVYLNIPEIEKRFVAARKKNSLADRRQPE
jgi:predicted acylesterase/phospholipase RssA